VSAGHTPGPRIVKNLFRSKDFASLYIGGSLATD
jgi:hypothetical protein